jgi:CSLREA domain-containing protein
MIGKRQSLRLCTLTAGLLGLFLGGAARAATITVNSLADPGAPGICTLRDAITAANTMTATNGCNPGSGNDTINFSPRMTGTISLVSTLPDVTDSLLTISGPASRNITISGGGTFLGLQAMEVAGGATLNLNNLSIANGFTFLNGAGIDNAGTLTVANSVFSGNSAVFGGGIFNSGVLTVTNSTFSGNRGSPPSGRNGAGGAIYNAGTTKIINSTFSGNFGLASGGAIANVGALTVINTTFFGNTTSTAPLPGEGGGIQNSGTLTVTFSTFSGNGGGPGGGISNGGFASLKNTILASSSGGPFNPPSNCFGAITDAGYNTSDDSTCGFAKTGSANNGDGVDPRLSPAGLADNGGPTQTIALQSGSPAIDAMPIADCTDQSSPPNQITTDQRGFARPDAGEAVCDVGAYESAYR